LSARKLAGTEDIPLCRLKNKVVLIVNGASHCGFTPQYKPLEALYEKHKDKGFVALAFPSQSFNQEDANEQTVSDFCTTENGITFPLFAIAPVIESAAGPEQPVYKWLNAQPGMSAPVAWNFEKFLISAEGKVVKRWLSAVSPDDGGEIDLAIVAELANVK
jgi:glutathione peroxidase